MSKTLRAGIAAIALALLSAAFSVIPDHRRLAWLFGGCAALLALVAILMEVISEARAHRNKDELARYLSNAHELAHREVKSQEAFDQWKLDLNSWYQNCNQFLTEKISAADAAVFRDLSHGGTYSMRRFFNSEHIDYLNVLRKHTENLREIISRY